MSYEKGFYRELAKLQGINLFEHILKEIAKVKKDIITIYEGWAEYAIIKIDQQIKLIILVSADDMASKFLVHTFHKLNKKLHEEWPHKGICLKLMDDCSFAATRAIQAHSHIWEKTKIETTLSVMGNINIRDQSSYQIPNNENKKDSEKYLLEYKEDEE